MVALLIQPFISILKLGFSRVLNRVRRNGVKVDGEQKKDDNEEQNDEVKDENDTAVQATKPQHPRIPSSSGNYTRKSLFSSSNHQVKKKWRDSKRNLQRKNSASSHLC